MKNKVHCEDNLKLMETLPSKSIDLIYIDPPFLTGKDFKEYDDRWFDMGYFLEYMDLRLWHCHRLLKDTGSLYLHCDYRTNYKLRVLLDKIFGEKNFANEIVWERIRPGMNASSISKMFPRNIDYIIVYKKTKKATFNKLYTKITENSKKQYTKKGTGRFFKTTGLGMYSKESIDKMKKNNIIYTSKTGKQYKKIYLDECKGTLVGSIWNDILGFAHTHNSKEKTNYPTQKPIALLERIIKSSSNEGDLVADFFCGSGTTLVAAKNLKRQYLGCDKNPEAVKITKERLRCQ